MTWNGSKLKAFYIPHPRKAFYIPYPRFILLDKTRIWLGMARKAFSITYPRFILLHKTRTWLGKHVSQEFMISVRPSATHPFVRTRVLSQPAWRPRRQMQTINRKLHGSGSIRELDLRSYASLKHFIYNIIKVINHEMFKAYIRLFKRI